MPWKEVSAMSQRCEFVQLAMMDDANVARLCRGFGISRKTGYKWLKRYKEGGDAALADRSRRPNESPNRCSSLVESAVLEVRRAHPAWGGRKIHQRLHDLGCTNVPSASTITAILRRHGQLDPAESEKHTAWRRFEHESPNDLWQMDFKGHVPMGDRHRLYPLTVLDDHSRYAVGLRACARECESTVRSELTGIFRQYGMPRRMLVDNGPIWRSDTSHRHTRLTVWLLRVGVRVTRSRVVHPQTLGKDERFHRTLKAEAMNGRAFTTLHRWQCHFDRWRTVYNCERPHESLNMRPPVSRYQASDRELPTRLPEIEYAPTDAVRKVMNGGWISYRGTSYRIGKPFEGERVALRPTTQDGWFEVYFCDEAIGRLDVRKLNRRSGRRGGMEQMTGEERNGIGGGGRLHSRRSFRTELQENKQRV